MPPDSFTLEGIKTLFDNSVKSSSDRFHSSLDSLVNSLISQVSAVPRDVSSATDVFDRVIPAFTLGVGDSTTGIYGNFVFDLTAAIDKASQSINLYVSNLNITTQQQLDVVQTQISVLSSHISSVASSASSEVGTHLSNSNEKFTNAVTISQQKSAEYLVKSATDSYIAAISRADAKVVADINKLLKLHSEYEFLPEGFYEDANTILTDISTDYNDAIDTANTVYNNVISTYKYWSTLSQSQINSSQVKIGAAITVSNAKVSALFSSVPSSLYNKADYAMSLVFSSLSGTLFAESIRVRNNLDNLVSKLAREAESSIKSIDRYFENSYVPIYVDGAVYRNAKSSLISSISKIVSDDLVRIVAEYNEKTDVIGFNYNTTLSTLQKSSIEFINKKIQGITEEQIEIIESKLSSIISASTSRVSVYFTIYSSELSHITSGVSAYLDKTISKYYNTPPLVRYTGHIEIPHTISGAVDNVFSFEVTNIGKIAWNGWFGIRLTGSTLDADGETQLYPMFKWNRRVGLQSVMPGQIVLFTVKIPGKSIYNLSKLGSPIVPSVIVNTYMGVSKLLVKK